jgi:hypothetical protein
MTHYDVLQIAEITRGIHPKDLLWVAYSKDERLDNIITAVFDSVFHQRIDLVGESLDTPEGYNIKSQKLTFHTSVSVYTAQILMLQF